ncbi:Ribonuclease MRP protein subunit rmp1 [Sporothrix curviconia]|uniref:Ribonuclease MRP protein subunit rmp1 n=1 Tax=Sporothrix curviconia TaxID=1260050 RepID=A0ABP0B287_9PEZI
MKRFAAAGERLDHISILLHGLHRLHKNQHRVSTYWWPAFGQLRRHVRRLDQEVRAVQADKNSAKFDKGAETEGVRRAVARAFSMLGHFIPKVYLAFSRLVADRRYAQLGLLLMGVLAQVHTALRQITGDVPAKKSGNEGEDQDGTENEAGSDNETAPKTTLSATLPAMQDENDDDDDDFGEVVCREDGTDDDKAEKKKDKVKTSKATLKSPAVAVAQPPTKKRPRPEDDDGDDSIRDKEATSMKPEASASGTKAGDETTVRPEKKKKKSDEGADVSEVREAPVMRDETRKENKEKRDKKDKLKDKAKKTKKRKKNGDEFDDLFSGLL